MNRRNVYLGGFMAAGKTSVGKALSEHLGLAFVDTDQVIEERAGKSISRIFSEEGESFFRAMERELIEELLQVRNAVISLGGGILADKELRRKIMERGTLVVLSVTPDTVIERVRSQKGQRPLLEKENLRSLWEKRGPAYREAHLHISTDEISVDTISREIERYLEILPEKAGSSSRCLECRTRDYSYPLIIGKGILGTFQDDLERDWSSSLVVSDTLTGALYGDLIEQGRGVHILPRGEEAKSQENLFRLFSSLHEKDIDREGTLVALGGGTVGDVTGFAAATWMRGIGLVQCPTTLLAQVDSAIGGKTAINMPYGKNLVGAFHQPMLVVADVTCLKTLPEEEFRQGMGEVLKYALGEDQSLLDWLGSNLVGIKDRDLDVLEDMVARCARIKAEIVSSDEKEKRGLRARLNLGHTVGHALEGASSYQGWKHGDAVAYGTLIMSRLSMERGTLDQELNEKFSFLFREFNFPTGPLPSWEKILPFIRKDKKFHSSRERFILPVTGEPSIVVEDMAISEIQGIYEKVMK